MVYYLVAPSENVKYISYAIKSFMKVWWEFWSSICGLTTILENGLPFMMAMWKEWKVILTQIGNTFKQIEAFQWNTTLMCCSIASLSLYAFNINTVRNDDNFSTFTTRTSMARQTYWRAGKKLPPCNATSSCQFGVHGPWAMCCTEKAV